MDDEALWQQFLASECQEHEDFIRIYSFVELGNFNYGEYEGNEYTIRKINRSHIQLENHVGTEVTKRPKVHSYSKGKFLSNMRQFYKRGND